MKWYDVYFHDISVQFLFFIYCIYYDLHVNNNLRLTSFITASGFYDISALLFSSIKVETNENERGSGKAR